MAKATIQDEIPPLDQIAGIPLPYDQDTLIGHENAEQELITAYRSERLHHAWIIGGPRGIGKATLAFRFARFVFAYPDRFGTECNNATKLNDFSSNPTMEHRSILTHTNILYLTKPWDRVSKQYKTEVTVDEVRRTLPFFGSTAGNNGWRVCIVDSADEMNLNAANALLKILEEPPERCIFLVLSHLPGRLLPTIRSRCRKMNLSPLSEQSMKLVLEKLGIMKDYPDDQVKLSIELAEGSVRSAVQLLINNEIEIAQDFNKIVKSLPKCNIREIHAFADKICGRNSKESFSLFKEMIRKNLSDMVRDGIQNDVLNRQLVLLADLWEKTTNEIALVEEFNLDRKQLVLNAFHHMEEAYQ